MKKIIALFASLTLICSFTSCAVRDVDSSESSDPSSQSTSDSSSKEDESTSKNDSANNPNVTKITVSDASKNYKGALVMWAKAENVVESGAAFELSFKVKDNAPEGDYDVHLYSAEFTDAEYADFDNEVFSGKIKVTNDEVEPEATTSSDKFALAFGNGVGAPGSEVKITADILNNPGIAGVTMILYYDNDVLELEGASVVKNEMMSAIFIANLELECEFIEG